MIRTLAARLASKVAVRGLCFALAVGGEEIPYIDLRGKLPTTGTYPPRDMARVNAIVIHHSATRGQSIHSIAQFHIQTKGWPAVAYHIAIGWDGKVYILNDLNTRTNHAQGFNTRSIGICLIGNYQDQPVPVEVQRSIDHVLAYLRAEHGPLTVYFHRDTKVTLCPGDSAVSALHYLKD